MAPPKAKAQKMSLGDFLGDQALGSWADEMEDMPVSKSDSRGGYGDRRATSYSAGFGGDRGGGFGGDRSRSDREFGPRQELPLPTKPPYTVHLGGLSYDATEGDIQGLFQDCAVTNVRIVEDKLAQKPKGFGYVEFGTLDGLKKALTFSGTQFLGRMLKVSVADPPKDRPDREQTRDFGNWERKGPLPDLPGNNQRRASERGNMRNFETASDAGSERGGGDRRRPPPFDADAKPRDFGNWERKGPLSPLPNTAGPRDGGRVRSGEPRERKLSPSWGEGRSQDGSRPPPRESREPREPREPRESRERPTYERQPTAADMDNQWRSKMRPDPPAESPAATPEPSVPSSPAAPAAPAQRPKLNLQKRTVSEAPTESNATPSGDSKASPFGAAKPIDTTARDKEIEERRQLALRQKKEQEDKERDEKKKAREASAKEDKEKVTSPTAESPREPRHPQQRKPSDVKDDVTEDTNKSRNYEILQRLNDEGNDVEPDAETAPVDGSANGQILGDKAIKPKEITREAPKQSQGSWRRKPSAPAESPATPTGETLEEEGWSTVPNKSKGSRRNQGARAIAS